MKNELVSVIIPVYNSERFLEESINSVLNQTYDNIEIIAIDDGSTDDSLKMLQKFSEKIYIHSQQNKGLAAALNFGISKMRGKWFKWLSPDDILYPKTIETLVIEAKKLPENTIVYSNWDLIDENNNKIRSFSESNYNNLDKFDFNVRLLDGQQINVNTVLIPSSIFSKGCTFQNLKDPVAIDYDFFIRTGILFDFGFHLVPECLIRYRIHSNQLSHEKISKSLTYIDEVKNQVLSHLDESKKMEYLNALEQYRKEKTIAKKTLEFGLKFAQKSLPEWVTDRMILFYLNKIRRTR